MSSQNEDAKTSSVKMIIFCEIQKWLDHKPSFGYRQIQSNICRNPCFCISNSPPLYWNRL